MPSFKGSSTDNSHISPHKPCRVSKTLPQTIHTPSHPTHAFLHAFFQRNKGSICERVAKESEWWFYMIFTVFCCTFMNHCNPDSSTKTHISSRTKHVFSITLFILSPTCLLSQRFTYPLTKTCLFSKALPQKTHISSHTNHAFFQRLFQRIFTYNLTQSMSFQ